MRCPQSEADTRKVRPPRANHLARRLKAAMTEVQYVWCDLVWCHPALYIILTLFP